MVQEFVFMEGNPGAQTIRDVIQAVHSTFSEVMQPEEEEEGGAAEGEEEEDATDGVGPGDPRPPRPSASTAAAPPPLGFNRGIAPTSSYKDYGMGMEKAYPYLFYSRSPTMHARQGPLTTTRMAFLLEQGSNLYTYAPWLFDVSSARSVADVNAQAKVRVEQTPPEKIKWLVETFASKRGSCAFGGGAGRWQSSAQAVAVANIEGMP
jgi:hypothetical protein